jgi:hypothetical protein
MMLGTYPLSAVPLSGTGQQSQVPSAAGAYTTTGQGARFAVALTGTAGAYAVTGRSAALRVLMRAAAGAYALTGQPATLRYIDNIRLRARDFSGYAFHLRDDSEGYW